MSMEFQITEGLPDAGIVSLNEAKHRLGVTWVSAAIDAEITGLLVAAERKLEIDTRRMYAERAVEISCMKPYGAYLELPVSPVQLVTSIEYTDTAGVDQEWAQDQWKVDYKFDLPRLRPRPGIKWPDVMCCTPDAFRLAMNAGYEEDAPELELARTAVLMLVQHWYDNNIISTERVNAVPFAYETIIWNLKTVGV
jgi:uncharacterized phiE125 gp8 family phage protein